jgi:hypothetical protein
MESRPTTEKGTPADAGALIVSELLDPSGSPGQSRSSVLPRCADEQG